MQRELFTTRQRQHLHQLSVLTVVLVLALTGVGAVGLSGPVGVASAQPITGCTVITQPGTYELTQNITNGGVNCIDIETSNVVFDGNGFTIDGTGSSSGVFASIGSPLTNVTVRNVTLTDWGNGIYYVRISDGAIHDIIAQNNLNGIHLFASSSNTIANNTVQQNNNNGIDLDDSSNTTIVNNTIQNNRDGIILSANSNNNTIAHNTVTNSGIAGVVLDTGASENLIYNNFLNNTNNVRVTGTGDNTWNVTQQPGPNIIGGPFLGGNYYATPAGDGFSQTCTDADGDGFCDQPKTIDANNVDFLPLTRQQSPDIAVSPTTLSFDTVTIGESVTANVTVINTGVATLNVTTTELSGPNASAFTLTDGSAPFSLAPGESHNVTVQFAPDAPGEKQATLTIESTDPNEATVAVALTGTAQAVFPEPLMIDVGGITLFEIGPPQDLDGDGLYEDVTGDDRFTLSDVLALDIVVTFYESGDLALTDAQVAALDFNQDGHLTEADTTALARRLLFDR
jgi:parallel beta-helix repeat protein